MISFTEPLWKAIGLEKTSALDPAASSDPTSVSDVDSVESSSWSFSSSTNFRPGRPYVAPPVMNGATVLLIGVALYLLARIYPIIILITTLLCALWIPYLFRINDDVSVRRRLYAQFCQEDHLPERFRNIQQYVKLEESYWTNDR
jgi:hypothetical protein